MHDSNNPDVEILPYTSEHAAATTELLARAFVTNPLHIAVFGADALESNRRFFRIALTHLFRAEGFVAMRDGKVVGYFHHGASPGCLPPEREVAGLGDSVLKPLGEAVPRIVEWFETWSRHDAPEPHLHLGPIGVDPTLQGAGLGSAMMRHYTERLDREGLGGYLETDRPINVPFYRRFGFEVVRELPVVGAPNWLMWREAKRGAA